MEPTVNLLRLLMCCWLIALAGCDRFGGTSVLPVDTFDRAVQSLQERDLQSARRLFEAAVAEPSVTANPEKLAIARTYLAQVHLELSEYRAASSDITLAQSLYTRLGDSRSRARLAAIAGDVEFALGRYRTAIERYEEAAAGALAFGDKADGAAAEAGVARSLLFSGDAEAALAQYASAAAMVRAIGDVATLAAAELGRGRAFRILRKYPEALDALTAAEEAARGGSTELGARIKAEIALVRSAMGNTAAAVEGLRDAVNALRGQQAGREDEPTFLAYLGSIYERMGRSTDAAQFYREASGVARKNGDRIGELYLKAAQIRSGRSEAGTVPVGDQWSALATEFRAIACASGEAYAYIQLGLLAERTGALADAQEYLAKGVALDQRALPDFVHPERHAPLRRLLSIQDPPADWYGSLARVLVRRERSSEALRVLEMGRLRQLRSAFRGPEVIARQPSVKQQTDDVRNALEEATILSVELGARLGQRDLNTSAAETQSMRENLESLIQRVRAGSSGVQSLYANYDLLVPSPVPDVAVLQRFIPRGNAVLTFLPTYDRLYLFVVTHRAVSVRSTSIRLDSLTMLVREYKQLLLDPRVYSTDIAAANVDAMTRFAGLSARLYDVFIRPATDVLERNLVIIPDALTEGLPFHAIERQSDDEDDVKYLIEIMGVDYLPSLSAFRYRVQPPTRTKDIVAFGNPSGKNWAVDYELRDLRSFARGTRVFVGLETAWSKVKTVNSEVLQLSTDFTDQTRTNPLGTVILSNGVNVEGTVPVLFGKFSELESIPVVVLSNSGGDGTGLGSVHAAMFRLNGASDVFLNCWSADRRAGKFFSEYFYTHLASGLAPGDAYSQALLMLLQLRDLNHPRAWGQFFHYGIG